MVISASLLLSWSVFRLVAGELSMDALQDAAPYIYCVVAFLVVPLSTDQERSAAKAITVVLAFQLAWVTLSVAGGGRVSFMPEIPWVDNPNENRDALSVFGVRPDFDVAVLGMFAALSLHRALSGRSSLVNIIVAVWVLSVIALGFTTSAGLLAVIAQMGVVAMLAPARRRLRPTSRGTAMTTEGQNRKIAVVLLLVAIPVGFLAVQKTTIFRDATLATGVAEPHDLRECGRSLSTANARQRSWERTVEELGSQRDTLVVGSRIWPQLSDRYRCQPVAHILR